MENDAEAILRRVATAYGYLQGAVQGFLAGHSDRAWLEKSLADADRMFRGIKGGAA